MIPQVFVILLVSILVIVNNYYFWKIWYEALAAYWIWNKIADFLFYPIIAWWIAFSTLFWYFRWKKDKETNKKLIKYTKKVWLFYFLIVLITLPTIWYIIWNYFTWWNEIINKYLLIILIFFAISHIWYIYEYLYSNILQIKWFHNFRIIQNFIYVFLIFIFVS